MFRRLLRASRFLLRRNRVEQELEAELRYHLERQTEENMRRGLSAKEAHLAARRMVGGVEQIKEECRDTRTGLALHSAVQDIRYGLRVLRKNPGFTAMAVATLAFGIGANTAVFSVVYGVLLRPLPYQQGGRLVVLHQLATAAQITDGQFSAKEVFDYRDHNHTLDAVVEHHSMSFLLLSKEGAERVETAVVSANFFDVLGVKPLLGRTFLAGDEAHGADAVLVLSNAYWRSRHGSDPKIVGKVFQMNNRPHTVIGVLPPIPQYPAESDVYMPTSQCPTRSSKSFIEDRQARMMTVFGRLKAGVPVVQAQADLSTVAKQMERGYPDAYPANIGYGIQATPLKDDLTRRGRTTFFVLLGAAGFVLFIACSNVATLLLARLLKLERELAVRTALGASKLRLVRQLLTESVLLSTAGGALGLAMAPPAVQLLARFAERFTTRAGEVRLDGPVLLFTLLLSVATGILFGLAPAFSSSRSVEDVLKQGGARTTASRHHQRLRSGLVLAQVAVSFVLLIGAGLMLRSFLKLEEVDPGFNPSHLLALRITPNFSRYGQPELNHLWSEVLRRVQAAGGVESAALATNFPFNPEGIVNGPGKQEFEIEGRVAPKGRLAPIVDINVISDRYFETMGQPLLTGRTFTARDDAGRPQVAVISEALARHYWPAGNPIGQRISFSGGKKWATIAGVVRNAKEFGLDHADEDSVYLPLLQQQFANRLLVRTAFDPAAAVPTIRALLHQIDPQLAIDRVDTVEHLRSESVAPPRLLTVLLGIFAGLAFLVSASGIAAMLALSVSQRRQELGIRMALGAQRRSVLFMIVRQGAGLALAGTLLGIGGALALTKLMSSLLFATSPTDVFTFAAVSLIFLIVAAAASLAPARMITAIDPFAALRQE